MNFKDMISEAKIDIDSITKEGTSAAEYMRSMFHRFGDDAWASKDSEDIRVLFGKAGDGHRMRLVKWGYFAKQGQKFKIAQKGIDWMAKNTGGMGPFDGSTDTGAVARGVKDISKLKNKKFLVPKVGNNSKYLDQMKKLLSHMKGFSQGSVKTTYMLAGDPGTGKTSFIKSLSTLTGVPLVVIEAPHITQEHLINIPFIVLDGPKEHKGNLTIDDREGQMKVVQAESNLVTQLKSKKKRTPEQVQKHINKNKMLRDIYPLIQNRISQINESYNSILFLDEFYRTSSMKIRNVLRNILNGKIGNDKIPNGVYIVMATNINDDGVEEIPLNQDFHLMDYDVSSKEDFMAYMYGQYVTAEEDGTVIEPANPEDIPDGEVQPTTDEDDEELKVEMKPAVWNKFMGELTDEMLGFNDEENDVRLSPRRLEQMMICINELLPVKTFRQAQLLMAFIRTNLSNYLEDAGSELLIAKFNEIAFELIAELKGDGIEIDIDKLRESPIKKSEWRDQLQSQIELKMKLGDARKYVPVVSGQPGVGKTSQMVEISKNLDMGFIQVDVSNLTPEDITGMPIADMSGDEITTTFSDPNLYITIMKEYNELIKTFKREGRKFNIVLLFDEMNRASIPVFNAIRKVLLEKEFESVKLPDDIVVTGAINPNDIGAMEFTSHVRDVLDIIPSAGNFSDTFKYIKSKSELQAISSRVGFDLHGAVSSVLQQLATEFKSNVDTDDKEIIDVDVRPFYWTDGAATFYVSPREMTETVANATNQIEDAFLDMNWSVDGSYTDEEFDLFIAEAVNVTAKSFVDSFGMITLKQEIQGFTQLLGMKITGNEKFTKLFEGVRTKKSINTLNLSQILDNANGDVGYLDKGIVGTYIKDFSSSEMIQDVSDITDKYINDLSGVDIIEKITSLYNRLHTSLGKLELSNNYTDQLNKYVGGKIVGLFKSGKVDILDAMDSPAIMKQIDKLTAA